MTDEVTVWVQADVLTVRTTLVPVGQASSLETVLLKALHHAAIAGDHLRADDICDVFGLAPRLVEDMFGDLWRAGRISIDLGTDREVIKLTADGENYLRELATGADERSSAARASSEQVAHDRLTGRVLPLYATRTYPTERVLMVPAMADDPRAATLLEAELADAVSRTVARRTRTDEAGTGGKALVDGMRIDAVYLAPSLLEPSRARRYIGLRVQPMVDATDELVVRVIDDALPQRLREVAGRRLQGLIADRPSAPFVNQLRRLAKRAPLRERDLDQMLIQFQRSVDGLRTCPPANRQRAHDVTARLANDVLGYVRAVALTEMDAEVVTTGEQHREVIVGMLRRAERQVVICSPFVRSRGVEPIRDALIAAVERGVQVTVLWGIDAVGKIPLEQAVLATFDAVQEHAVRSGAGGALRFNRERGARIHAKVVVRDDRELLVTSKNLSDSGLFEVGVLLRVPDVAVGQPLPGPVVEDVLQFLYNHAPDPTTALQLLRTRGAFGPRRDDAPLPEIPLPRLTATVLDPAVGPEHAAAWAAAWQDAARAVTGLATDRPACVEVITDGQHAALVRQALEGAARRVLVASHRTSEQAVPTEVCALAGKRAADGMDVAMRYGETRDTISGDRLAALAATGDRPADVGLVAGMHAKVVIRDDSTVLGSFNHLSVDAGVRGRRATAELSVRIGSAAVADAVWRTVLGRTARGTVTASGRADPAPVAVTASPQALLSLLEPEVAPDADALVEMVAAHGADSLLATAERLGLGAGARRQVLAAAALRTGNDRDLRLTDLIQEVWSSGAWACADVLRRAIADRSTSPRPVLTAALADPGSRLAVLLELAFEEQGSTAAEAAALAVSTAVGLLLGELDVPEIAEVLAGWVRPVDGSDGLVAAAAAYWMRYGPLPPELPSEVQAQHAATGLQELRAALGSAIESLRRYDTHSDSGDIVRDHLFERGGEMTELLSALEAGDSSALLAWEDAYGERNDSRWLVRAAKAAGQPPIDDHRKTSFIEKHRAIRLAVHELGVAAAEDERRRSGHEVLSADQVTEIRALDVLAAAVAPDVTGPEQAVVVRELGRLRARLAGRTGPDRPAPGADLASWALPRTRVAVITDGAGADLVTEVCRDLAAGWTEAQAVAHLLDAGEFGLAADTITRLRTDRRVDEAVENALRRALVTARASAQDLLTARAQALSLRCERVGLGDADARSRDAADLGERVADSLARWEEVDEKVDGDVRKVRKKLDEQLTNVRAGLSVDWADHIDGLIEDEELAVARLALSHRGGRTLLPQPVRLTPWSWRTQTLVEVAGWFESDGTGAPKIVREFLPQLGDDEAVAVVQALRMLAAGLPGAAAAWVAATQALVAEVDDEPDVQPAEGGITATFRLPYDVRLPPLRWTGRPEPATVGGVPERGLLHFSTDLTDHGSNGAVISVSDVLSLLGPDQSGRPAPRPARAMRFLGMVCSRLPLSQVIAPHDTPAEYTLDGRMMLAWLLHLLGFSYTATDLDLLRLVGGGHEVPLWHLIDGVRADPLAGISRLREHPQRDEILQRGLAADLDGIDLLVLSTLLSMQVTERAGLRSAVELVWEDAVGTSDVPPDVDVEAAADRLIAKGYLIESGERLRDCGCAVVTAQRRRVDLESEISRMVRNMHARSGMNDMILRDLLVFSAMHADQAEAALRSPEERQASARRTLKARMSDPTPFDLWQVCDTEARRAEMMRDDVDVYWNTTVGDPVWVVGPEMPYIYLVRELLSNAISAVGKSGSGTGSVRLALDRDGDAATLTVSDSGPGFPDDFLVAFRERQPLVRPDRPDRGNGFHRLRSYFEANGAAYELDQEADGGAVVMVVLPVVTGPDGKDTT